MIATDFTWAHPIEINGKLMPGTEPLDYLEWKASFFPRSFDGASLLDVGACDGWFSFRAEERGALVTALDTGDYARDGYWNRGWSGPSDQLPIEYAIEQRASSVRFVRGSAADAPTLFDEQFNVITCLDVYYHMVDPVVELRALLQVLAPGGQLMFAGAFLPPLLADADGWGWIRASVAPDADPPPGTYEMNGAYVHRAATIGTLTRLLEELGLQPLASTTRGNGRVLILAGKPS